MLIPAAVTKKTITSGVLGGILSAAFLFWSSLSLAEAPNAIRLSPPKRACDNYLNSTSKIFGESLGRITNKLHVINVYSRYYIEPLPADDGYILRLLSSNESTPTLDVGFQESKTLWKMNDWKIGDRRFQHLDSGFTSLATESNLINHKILMLSEQRPDANLRVQFSPAHAEARNDLFYLRWRMHDAVLKKYVEKKRYLRASDYAQLTWATGWSDNTDAFGLLTGDPKPAEQMDWDELYDRLALTMQITYFGRRDFFRPSVRAGLYATSLKDFNSDDMLPFEFRLDTEQRELIAKTVYTRFNRTTTCELTRYARFSDIPREAHDLFLLKILERLEGRGMHTILASVDEVTAVLFGRAYGFKVLMQISTHQTEEKEYLAYLEVGTPQYEAMKARLKQSARAVTVTK